MPMYDYKAKLFLSGNNKILRISIFIFLYSGNNSNVCDHNIDKQISKYKKCWWYIHKMQSLNAWIRMVFNFWPFLKRNTILIASHCTSCYLYDLNWKSAIFCIWISWIFSQIDSTGRWGLRSNFKRVKSYFEGIRFWFKWLLAGE